MTPVLPVDPTPITTADLKVMFKLFAGLDGHKREAPDVEVWMIAAQAGRWTRAQAAAAARGIVVAWTGFRVLPGHVAQQIAADRERIRQGWYCPDPPRHLGSNPAAEIAWRRRAQASYAERALLALATGEPVESVPLVLNAEREPRGALAPTEMARRVEAAAATIAENHAVPAGDDPVPQRRVTLDPDVRRQVREELAQRRTGTAS